jgi:hypothetical protein
MSGPRTGFRVAFAHVMFVILVARELVSGHADE